MAASLLRPPPSTANLDTLDNDIVEYIAFKCGLAFCDLVALSGVCAKLHWDMRGDFLHQLFFLRALINEMKVEERAKLSTLKNATHLILRWKLIALYQALRLRTPKKSSALSAIFALCEFGFPANNIHFDWQGRRMKHVAHRAMLLRLLRMDQSSAPKRKKLPSKHMMQRGARGVYVDLVGNNPPIENLLALCKRGYHLVQPHILWLTRQVIGEGPIELDLQQIRDDDHPKILEKVFPDERYIPLSNCMPAHPYLCFESLPPPLSTHHQRCEAIRTHRWELIRSVKNIDLIITFIALLDTRLKDPEEERFASKYRERHSQAARAYRTFAQVVKDGTASLLAGEPFDLQKFIYASAKSTLVPDTNARLLRDALPLSCSTWGEI